MAFLIGKNCRIHPSVVINVNEGFIGDGALILEGAKIEGRRIEIGRESYIDRFAIIGGGSCFDPDASLVAGDWFHMGVNSQINIARGVRAGHELGCGIDSKIFTHGAYIDSYRLGAPVQWAPVEIGDSVWMPNVWVNPGVKIGSNVIVSARSLVNRDLPSGCFAGGVPAKVIKENYLPRSQTQIEKQNLISEIVRIAMKRFYDSSKTQPIDPVVNFEAPFLHAREGQLETVFNLQDKTISGAATDWSLMLKDQLRRNGIRFRFTAKDNLFVPWRESQTDI